MKNKNKKLRKIATLSLGITFPVISVASAVADLNSDAEIKIDNLNITLDTSKTLEGKNNLISKEHVFSSFFVGSKINLHSSVKINNLNAGNVSMSREVQWKNTSVEYIDQDFHVDFNENDLINIKDWNALSFALSFDIQDAGSNEDSGMYGNVDEIKYALWQDSGIDITKYDVYVSGMDWQVNTSTRHSDDLFWNGWKHTQELHMNKISFTLKQKENFVASQIEGTKVLTAVMLSEYGIYNQIGVLKGYNPLSFTEQRIVMRDFLFIKDIDNNTVEYETTNRDDISWWNIFISYNEKEKYKKDISVKLKRFLMNKKKAKIVAALGAATLTSGLIVAVTAQSCADNSSVNPNGNETDTTNFSIEQ